MSLGYPKDKGFQLCYSLGKGFIEQSDNRYEIYSYVESGMSGGPLIGFFSDYDDHIQDYTYYHYIIGINSTKEPDTREKNYHQWSGITRISNTMIDFIRSL